MNEAATAALRLACAHVERHRLVMLADIAVAGGSLGEATAAVRTSTTFGSLTDAGEVHATSAGLRVRPGPRGGPERFVTWTSVAATLLPVLRGDLGVAVVAAAASDPRHWRNVVDDVVDAAVTAVPVQPSLFPAARPRRDGQAPSWCP